MLSAPNEFPENGRGAMNNLKRDRFELLSAYLDGEVSADERRQVEAWLAEDPTIQQLHRRLLKLRQGFQSLPVPSSAQPIDATIDQVMHKVEQRSRFRVIMGGGMAAAAAIAVAIVSQVTSTGPAPQVANRQPSGGAKVAIVPPTNGIAGTSTGAKAPAGSSGLMIALDQPVLVISKTAVADDANPAPTRIGETQTTHSSDVR